MENYFLTFLPFVLHRHAQLLDETAAGPCTAGIANGPVEHTVNGRHRTHRQQLLATPWGRMVLSHGATKLMAIGSWRLE